jgi:hypothetical protein
MLVSHLEYFRPFGIVCGDLVYFPPFWYVLPRKIWQPWPTSVSVKQGRLNALFSMTRVRSFVMKNGSLQTTGIRSTLLHLLHFA